MDGGDGVVVVLISPGELPAGAADGPGSIAYGGDVHVRVARSQMKKAGTSLRLEVRALLCILARHRLDTRDVRLFFTRKTSRRCAKNWSREAPSSEKLGRAMCFAFATEKIRMATLFNCLTVRNYRVICDLDPD